MGVPETMHSTNTVGYYHGRIVSQSNIIFDIYIKHFSKAGHSKAVVVGYDGPVLYRSYDHYLSLHHTLSGKLPRGAKTRPAMDQDANHRYAENQTNDQSIISKILH